MVLRNDFEEWCKEDMKKYLPTLFINLWKIESIQNQNILKSHIEIERNNHIKLERGTTKNVYLSSFMNEKLNAYNP